MIETVSNIGITGLRQFSVRICRAVLLCIISLPLTGCMLYMYGVTDSPEHPMELSIHYDGRCVGTVQPAGMDPIAIEGMISGYGVIMEQESKYSEHPHAVLFDCRFGQNSSKEVFSKRVSVRVFFEDYIGDFATDYVSDFLISPPSPKNKGFKDLSGHFHLEQDELLLAVARASNRKPIPPYQDHEQLPTLYSVKITTSSPSFIFKRPYYVHSFTCRSSGLYSKYGTVKIFPVKDYKPDGLYATIKSTMVIGGAHCL